MTKKRAQIVSSDDDEEEEEEEEEEVEEETSDEAEQSEQSESESEGEDSSSEEHENSGEASKKEALKKLLEPFGKEQIIDILKDAAAKNPSIRSRILRKAESDPTHRKIFVHGLGWDTTEEQLLQVFKPFGEIEEHKLITDKVTGKAKGYAFVLFKTLSAAQKALKVPQKVIGNRTTSCQLASLGPAGNNVAGSGSGSGDVDAGQRKIFVKNVAPTVNVDRLRAFFGNFGEIENGPLGLDPVTNKPRGYAIFTYKSVDGLKKALEEPVKVFEGCQLNCKKFVESHQNANVNKVTSNNTNAGNVNYGQGLNMGDGFGSAMTAGGMLMQQNPGFGLVANPMWAAAALNPAGFGAAMPGVGANYGTQAALLQGYGVSMEQSPVGGGAGGSGSARNQTALGFPGMNFPSYYSN
ncbi:OLC1v1013714C1 [Oldenlandia corymbosa var. corymbosa]|uniref:OLC1v1013714C1 n=1 Tax=Oldenlandia corymbosa var. corymbosa TaxID=529605 RepID=A0AAV1E2J8_OLDCO|nr:OLC1v1013714C1 [Oldenlandia corymbosa var. corymbosa]